MAYSMEKKVDRAARILILEDDPSLRDVLQEVLEARGLQVTVASNGEQALNLARAQPFDLIVADIRMKGISGLDAIEQARQLQPDMASIVVSGYATEQETLRAVQLNVAGYLKKPFKIPKLLELVNNLLSQRRLKMQTEEEIQNLRKSLLWSLSQQTKWAEKANPGKIERPARLAYGLAKAKGLSLGLCEQIHSGTALRASFDEEGGELPESVARSLEPFSLLLAALESHELSDLAFVVNSLMKTSALPDVDQLPSHLPDSAKELYRRYAGSKEAHLSEPGEQADEEIVETETLFSVAANLERLGDLPGADKALDQIIDSGEFSAMVVQGHLGKARIAILRGRTQLLEHHVKQALDVAAELGPSLLARVEWEGAMQLRRVKHPVASKLFRRAAESMHTLGQKVPWACCILALSALEEVIEEEDLEAALSCLGESESRPEVAELVNKLLPDLLILSTRTQNQNALDLSERLVKGFYFMMGSVLLQEALPRDARLGALELMEKSKLGLSDDLVVALKQLGDSEISTQVDALQGGQNSTGIQIRANCFGSFIVSVGNKQLSEKDWKTQKTKYLLARLLENSPRTLQVDQLLEEFWPNKAETSRNSLNTCVSTLRRAFRGAAASGEEAIQRVGTTLALNSTLRIWSDEKLLSEAVKQAETYWDSGELEKAMSAYTRVIRLYEGPYLDGCYLDWALARRTFFERKIETALSRLMEHRFGQHRFRESLEYAKNYLRIQPDDTRSHEVVMLSLMGLDKHPQAVEHYETYSQALRNQCGSEPSIELMKVYQMAKYGFRQESGLSNL